MEEQLPFGTILGNNGPSLAHDSMAENFLSPTTQAGLVTVM
jgi:hypothetical protein